MENKMREIKFRAWDSKHKEMILPSQEDPFDQNLAIGLNGKIYSVGDSGGDGGWCVEDDYHNYILLEYTGLKSKSGVDIYEGDIVKLHNEEIKEVKFEELGDAGATYGIGWDYDIKNDDLFTVEIIGNIYQDSHLLNK